MSTPPGWPQQQQQPYPLQPGYPPGPGYPPRPPKPKSKAPKVIGIIAIVLVVLAVGGLAGWRAVVVSTDAGVEPNGRQPKPECAVGQQALDFAKVSVNTTDGLHDGGVHVCSYATRKGSDGLTEGSVTVTVQQVSSVQLSVPDPLLSLTSELQPPTNYKSKAVSRLGDKSAYVWQEYGDKTYAALAVLKGKSYFKVAYYGYTKGFFGNSPVPADRVEADLLLIAKDLDQRITG